MSALSYFRLGLGAVCRQAVLSRNSSIIPSLPITTKLFSSVVSTQDTSNRLKPLGETHKSLILGRNLNFPPQSETPRLAWVESLSDMEGGADSLRGMVHVHPDIFAVSPDLNLIHRNMVWQSKYKNVDWRCVKSRSEMRGSNRKPWPQKGLGKARQGSIRAPHWIRGGAAKGPRGPKTSFYMLTLKARVDGLKCTLSMKFAQDDIKIVDSFDSLPTDDPEFLLDLVDKRVWGPSVLFVDDTDIFAPNISAATDRIKHMNLMPVYGLNVHSMLKHDTLVLTVDALERIEERLLFHMNRTDFWVGNERFSMKNLPS